MENDTFGGAILAWVKSAKAFLKVQAGTGDNLLEEDFREGLTDYCLWSTFRPESIDTDGELDMECLDSGMVLFRETVPPERRWNRATVKPSAPPSTRTIASSS